MTSAQQAQAGQSLVFTPREAVRHSGDEICHRPGASRGLAFQCLAGETGLHFARLGHIRSKQLGYHALGAPGGLHHLRVAVEVLEKKPLELR